MGRFTVVYDACVLYPAPLRDFLMHLAMTDLFAARWTDKIHDEWIENLLINRSDLTRRQLERTRDLMNANVRDCLVVGYEPHIPLIELPDENDRHVLAAAIKCKADAIVTWNLKDFPRNVLEVYGIEPIDPDAFIAHQIGLSPKRVCQAARIHRSVLKKPPKAVDEYLETLRHQNLQKVVAALTDYRDEI